MISFKYINRWLGISNKLNRDTYTISNFNNTMRINPLFFDIKNLDELYNTSEIVSYEIFCVSPTSCQFTSKFINSETKKYFYVDQQDIAKWFMIIDDKSVYVDFNKQTYKVSNSLAEFLTRMSEENFSYFFKKIKYLK